MRWLLPNEVRTAHNLIHSIEKLPKRLNLKEFREKNRDWPREHLLWADTHWVYFQESWESKENVEVEERNEIEEVEWEEGSHVQLQQSLTFNMFYYTSYPGVP